jgi:site-specific recombinase XerD
MASPEDDTLKEIPALLGQYEQFLSGKATGTKDAYLRTVRDLIGWVVRHHDKDGHFQPSQLTETVVEMYLTHLEQEGFSINHRTRVKSTISNFAQFLIEEQGLLRRNPTRGIDLPPVVPVAPQEFSEDQRYILRSLIKQQRDKRGAALFALGYWAGCRVSEISMLQMAHTHVGSKVGWLHIGSKEGKWRDIDLMNEARKPLFEYLQSTRDTASIYVFLSQRSGRLTEEGIYYWFRTLKAQAIGEEWKLIEHLSFNNLRQDFVWRAREAGWSLEELAYYLGDLTSKGVSAIQSNVHHPQVSREQVKQKLNNVKG